MFFYHEWSNNHLKWHSRKVWHMSDQGFIRFQPFDWTKCSFRALAYLYQLHDIDCAWTCHIQYSMYYMYDKKQHTQYNVYILNIHRWFPVFCFFWFDDSLYRGLENDSSKISAALHVGMVCVPRWLKQRQIPRTKEGAVGKQPQPQSMLMFLLWK